MADDDSTEAPAETVDAEQHEAVAPDVEAAVKDATRKANKEAETLRRRLKEFEDRDKTEQQKLTEERDSLVAERDAARVDATRLRLGIRYKLGEDDLDFLGSGSDEDMEARAKRFSERVAAPSVRGAVDQGVRGEPASGKPGMNDLIRAASGRS